jgi:hypothetical protein
VSTFFLLGSHQPGWLAGAGVPLFVSDRRLRSYRRLPRAVAPWALAPWALDSGGFTELQQFGRWTVGPADYVRRVRRYREEIGRLLWAAPQDWMCEPVMIGGGRIGPITFAGTGLTIAEHQRRTVENLLQLRALGPDLPFIPVLQGYDVADYLTCARQYEAAGVDVTREPLVGVGSVCRRQATTEAGDVLLALHRHGITRLHGFGIKLAGLHRYGPLLASADSMAWSIAARRAQAPMPGCTRHKNCANCLRYALRWRNTALDAADHLFTTWEPAA